MTTSPNPVNPGKLTHLGAVGFIALLVCFETMTASARERISFNDGWLFQMGDPAGVGDKLAYQNIKDWVMATGLEWRGCDLRAA